MNLTPPCSSLIQSNPAELFSGSRLKMAIPKEGKSKKG